jgi:hypothetical protein
MTPELRELLDALDRVRVSQGRLIEALESHPQAFDETESATMLASGALAVISSQLNVLVYLAVQQATPEPVGPFFEETA